MDIGFFSFLTAMAESVHRSWSLDNEPSIKVQRKARSHSQNIFDSCSSPLQISSIIRHTRILTMHVKHLLTLGALLFTVLEAAPLAGISKAPVCLVYSMLTPLATMASVRRSKYTSFNLFKYCLSTSCLFYANFDLEVLQSSQGYVSSSSPLMS